MNKIVLTRHQWFAAGLVGVGVALASWSIVLLNDRGESSAAVPAGIFGVEQDDGQNAILEDNRVEAAEYASAFSEYLTCLDDNGVPYHDAEYRDQRNPPKWEVIIGPYHIDSSDEVDSAERSCAARHYLATELAWQEQEGPSEAELQALRLEVLACFNERTGARVETPDDIFTYLAEDHEAEAGLAYVFCQQLIVEGNDIRN